MHAYLFTSRQYSNHVDVIDREICNLALTVIPHS